MIRWVRRTFAFQEMPGLLKRRNKRLSELSKSVNQDSRRLVFLWISDVRTHGLNTLVALRSKAPWHIAAERDIVGRPASLEPVALQAGY